MGRLFAGAAGERIETTGTTNLGGMTWTYGTVGIIFKHSSTAGTQCLNFLSFSGSTAFQWYADAGSTVTYWNSGTGSNFSYSPGTTNTHMGFISKGTGTVLPFFAFLNMNTGVWTSGNGDTNQANHGTLTNVVLGSEDLSGSSPFLGEMWEIAYWPQQAMTLEQMKTMAGGQFGRYQPGAWWAFPPGRDNTSLVGMKAYGRYPLKPSTHIGATRGTTKNPPGWRVPVAARRH